MTDPFTEALDIAGDIQGAATMAPLLDMITGAGPEQPPEPTPLAIIPPSALPTLIAADPDDILGKLKAELDGYKPDVTTPKGRDEIRSVAFKPRRAKAAFEKVADKLKEGAQKTIKDVNAELKVAVAGFDELAEALRKPLDDYEAIEKNRVTAHAAALTELTALGTIPAGCTSAEIDTRYAKLDTSPLLQRDWQEYRDRAQTAAVAAANAIKVARMEAVEREKTEEQVRQTMARLQAEREAQIAAEAAAEATRLAEAAAVAEAARVAAEAERVAQEAETERLRLIREAEEAEAAATERERLAAVALAEEQARAAQLIADRESDRISRHEFEVAEIARIGTPLKAYMTLGAIDAALERVAEIYKRDWQEYAQEAELAKDDAQASLMAQRRRTIEEEDARRETARLEAERLAPEAESQRLEGIRIQQEAALRARETDLEHKAGIHRE